MGRKKSPEIPQAQVDEPYQEATAGLCVGRPCDAGDARHRDLLLALDVADGHAVAALQHGLAELDSLAARGATLDNDDSLLLEEVLPEIKRKRNKYLARLGWVKTWSMNEFAS